MKALIGVDASGQCSPAVDLFQRLSFDVERLTLLHSVESVLPDGSFPGMASGGMMAQIYRDLERVGRNALEETVQQCRLPLAPETRLAFGDPVRTLLDAAEEMDVDLIGVGTGDKGALEAMIAGSVTRGLLTASRHSFLAAKRTYREEGPLTAIVATDHSEYAKRCMELLLSFAPEGIGRAVVLTVVDEEARRSMEELRQYPEFASSVETWAEDRLERENLALCRRLADIVPQCEAEVRTGSVNENLAQAVRDHQADLLIMGAQGHGFIERLRSGSVSFHQVVAEKHSVLVLRP